MTVLKNCTESMVHFSRVGVMLKKIECRIRKMAEPTPKIVKIFKPFFSLITKKRLLFVIQYLISKIAVIIIPGLNKR